MLYGAITNVKRTYFKKVYTDFVQPTLAANGTVGGDSFACFCSSSTSASYDAWKAFQNAYAANQYWLSTSGLPEHIGWYNPTPLRVSAIAIQNRGEHGSFLVDYEIQASNDDSTWDSIASGTLTETGLGVINTIEIESETAYKYWKVIGEKCAGTSNTYFGVGRITITAQEETITESEEPTEDYKDEVQLAAPLRSMERRYFKTETTIQDFVQPTLTENGEWGGDAFAVDSSSYLNNDPDQMAWKAFRNAYDGSTKFHSQSGLPQDLMWYNPNPLRISNIALTSLGQL